MEANTKILERILENDARHIQLVSSYKEMRTRCHVHDMEPTLHGLTEAPVAVVSLIQNLTSMNIS